jgi:thioredoxin 2
MDADNNFTLRCPGCRTKNRIPATKVGDNALCGKCGAPLPTEILLLGLSLNVTEGDFNDKVMQSPLPTLLFCWAPWCPSCQSMMPVIDELAYKLKGKLRVGKLNMDQNPNIASRFNIMAAPTTLIFDNGHILQTIPGAMPAGELLRVVQPHLYQNP